MAVSLIGKSPKRIDAPAKVTGSALYSGDISAPGLLHMATLFSHHVHARIRAIDATAALAAPGVLAVLTAADVPVNEHGLQVQDQPVLCGPGSSKPGADIVRFVGDQVALVVAETEVQARAALPLIYVEWEDLPPILDPETALAPGAPLLHPGTTDNVISSYRVRKGDVEAAFAGADVVIEQTYHTPVQEHAYLQPEAGVAYIDEAGRITVEAAGQWTTEDQVQIAHALNLPLDQVRVIYPAIGGAFGGREDISVQIVLALAVWRLAQKGIRRPIKALWSREESIEGHGKRHAMRLWARWGARKDGTLVAAQVKVVADGGAYCYTSNKVLGNCTLTCTGPYQIPNVAVDTQAVYTNQIPGAAFRGFGGPQGLFEAESQMDRLAEALGMDPVALRLKNILTDESLLSTGSPIPGGVGLTEVVRAAAEKGGWQEDAAGSWRRPAAKPAMGALRYGLGMACGFKNVGFSFGYQEHSHARVELSGSDDIEEAVLYVAGADVGQGNHTIAAQIAATALQIPLERVRVVASDTAWTGDSGSASASRLTYMSGNAILGAARAALVAWANEDRPAVGDHTYLAPKSTQIDPKTGQGSPNFAYGYAAQVAEVSVDTETGEVRVERFISADDVGQAINPDQVIGQIEGGSVQALGYTLLEDFRTDHGKVLSNRLSTYLIPTVLDVPKSLESIIVQVPDPRGPHGARGMAEMPYLPAAPAVCAAVYDAIGVRFNDFPLTPERVWRGMRSTERAIASSGQIAPSDPV
jgi:CO/xanthine dehydrogenase Mo-binding subunit